MFVVCKHDHVKAEAVPSCAMHTMLQTFGTESSSARTPSVNNVFTIATVLPSLPNDCGHKMLTITGLENNTITTLLATFKEEYYKDQGISTNEGKLRLSIDRGIYKSAEVFG